METRHNPAKRRFVRNAIRKDLLYFGLPALIIFSAGLIVSLNDGWVNLAAIIRAILRHPRGIAMLSAWNLVGLTLVVIGFVIAFIAQITLGRFYYSFLVIWEDHQLVMHGIYRFIRHPIYLGVLMVSIGLALFAASLYGVLIMLVLIPIFLYRIRIEEKLLSEEFGDTYREYVKTTSKLIPFIY